MRYAVILAGGCSERYGRDKLEEMLFGKSVLQHSTDAFDIAHKTVVVGRQVEGMLYAPAGETRFLSVLNGLQCIPDDGVVAVHDGARPFVNREFVERLYAEAEHYGSAVPALPLTDTLYRKDGTTEDRRKFITVQTPQVFDTRMLRQAYTHACERGETGYTDDGSVFAAEFGSVHFTDGLRSNIKLTFDGDLPQFRVGTGYDVHPFVDGDGVVLGGVKIPFDKRLNGHSDADVLCHAVCDAVLSAGGQRDIGCQFPDSDPAYAGIDSTLLLDRCVSIVSADGFCVENVSATVICQAPKIAPYTSAIEARIAQVCRISARCVNVSATTTERLGSLGNGDGIAAQAVVLLRKIK